MSLFVGLLAVFLDSGLASPRAEPATREEQAFGEKTRFSNVFVRVSAVSKTEVELTCPQGRKVDWAEFVYRRPNASYSFTDDDRWRCVERVPYDDPTPLFESSKGGPIPGRSRTEYFSNLDAKAYELFRKPLRNNADDSFAWHAARRTLVVFYVNQNEAPQDAARTTWSLVLNEYRLIGKRFADSQLLVQDLYSEPKVRLFHPNDRYDVFLVQAAMANGGMRHYVWALDMQRGGPTKREDHEDQRGETVSRFDFVVHGGLLWMREERRLAANQKGRLFEHWYWENDGFKVWREQAGAPALPPPPPPMP